MSNKIICGSFDEHKSYFNTNMYDKKTCLQVKIVKCDENETSQQLEERLNNLLIDFNGRYEIVDIKYAERSCMIIYRRL
jgi:hypothetical protein